MASRYRRKKTKRRTRRLRRRQKGGAELSYTAPNAAIKVFTSSDKMKPTLETLLASLKKHHYSYEVLGFGKPWKGFETKIENYLEGMTRYAKEKGPDALAIFIDAFDVICIKDSDKLLATYKAKPRPMPVVFGAEVVCFNNCYKDILTWYDTHNVLNGRAAIEADLKPADSSPLWKKPVFMNTGFIMGPVAQLQQMFTEIAQTPFEVDDQYTAGKWAVSNLDKFDLDGEESMIRNKVGNHEKLPDEYGNRDGPAFLHFPGSRAPEQQEELLKRYAAYI